MKYITIILTMLMFSVASWADSGATLQKRGKFHMQMIEGAAEVAKLDIKVSGEGEGYTYVRICDECDSVRLQLDAKTRLQIYSRATRSKTATDLANLKQFLGHNATVLFNPNTNRITRIVVSI
ncbi:MAG: hypothetical protein HKM24_05165 [Gammaproteobacteria bacterium]|nr:hypothetical protein [Gammaproteobacteria bacterium]